MVVLATNRPGDLDDAVLDRMDEAIHFDLPGRDQRKQLLGLYLDKYISKAGTLEVRCGHHTDRQLCSRLYPHDGFSVSFMSSCGKHSACGMFGRC
jgi:SpoVK/Ycf46/Vps4 family AAA+-type ATPase